MNKYKVRQRRCDDCVVRKKWTAYRQADLVIQLDDKPENIGETAEYIATLAKWSFMSFSHGLVPGINKSIYEAIETVVQNLLCVSASYYVAKDRLGDEEVWWISISFDREKKQLIKPNGRPYRANFDELAKRLLQEAIDRDLQE